MMETCFSEQPYVWFRRDYENFSCRVYEGRWASVSIAVGKLLWLGPSLRPAWSMDKYTFKRRANEGDAAGAAAAAPGPIPNDTDDHHMDIQVIDAAINSPFFWAYASMIDMIAETHELIMHWAEGCLCHGHMPTSLQGPARHDPRRRMAAERENAARRKRCPLCGMRAPELAAGALHTLLDFLWNISHGELITSAPFLRLGVPEQAKILADFARARQHTFFV